MSRRASGGICRAVGDSEDSSRLALRDLEGVPGSVAFTGMGDLGDRAFCWLQRPLPWKAEMQSWINTGSHPLLSSNQMLRG